MRIPGPLLIALLATLNALGTNWPNWRGPNSDGSTSEKTFPLSWDRTNNVRWRVPLPGPGNSSPIIWNDQVFITQAVGPRRTLWCINAHTGLVLWQSGPNYELPEETMRESNPYCTASPVTDGERVIAFFGSAGLYCFDLDGHERWHTHLGKISHILGSGSSPCLGENLCYVYVGPGPEQSLVAVDKRTGEIAWRTPAVPPTPEEAKQVQPNGPPTGSWSTPLLINHHGRKELVMCFAFRVGSYDLLNGKLLWQSGGLGLQTYVTPQFTDDLLVMMSGTVAHALRLPGAGVPAEEILWTQPKSKPRFGSGVATDKHLFYVSENGLAECWDKSNGQILWQERLQGPGKKRNSWSSLSRADKTIYVPNQSGDVFAFAADPTFRVLSTNSIAEPTNASLALSNGTIIMRTDHALWCFALPAKS